jgi:hypothetical protein
MEAQVSRVGQSDDSLRPSAKVEIAGAEVARVAELANYQKGSVEIRISGQLFSLSVGDVILMPANQPHAVRALSAFKMLLTMIRS